MGIKNKRRDRNRVVVGRTKKFMDNISVTVWKNQKGVCSACRKYLPLRFKIQVSKPLNRSQLAFNNTFYTHEEFVCGKVCRTMVVLQNIS